MQMGDGHDHNLVVRRPIDHAIGKPLDAAAPCVLTQRMPGVGECLNPRERREDLIAELGARPGR
jgi:hypothetical protein